MVQKIENSIRGRSQITLCIFHFFLTTHPPMVMFCNYFTKYLLNEIWNGYILLTTHPPQWYNVICERPLSLMGFSLTSSAGLDGNASYQAQELQITTQANPGIQTNFLPPRLVQS